VKPGPVSSLLRTRVPLLGLALVTVTASGLMTAACGLRSDADDDGGGGGETFSDETGTDPREGSCDTPYVLPFANFEVRGRLLGPGKVRGWCGRLNDDVKPDAETDTAADVAIRPDAGPEDSYIVTPTFNVDVLVVVPDADFEPSLRVTKDGCREDVLPSVCAAPMGDDLWHFFAEVGHSYTITIDSPEGTDGNYTMQVLYGDPGVAACPIHPSQIDQEHGGFFTWSNQFGRSQGHVDGLCGGPGTENMFQINVNYPGNITFNVEADASFAPVLSVRSGCGGATELICTSAAQTGSNFVSLNHFFEVPGTYFVVVDQGDIDGGSYKLEVFSD
jgi:hypothetical protein